MQIRLIARSHMKYLFIAVIVFGVLIGALSARSASAATPQTFIVQVGAGGPGNVDLLQFAPGTLKVHRGDTVTWLINGFHNVHVGATKSADLAILADVKGQKVPAINPALAFPYGPKDGTAYQSGEANSGLALGPDAKPIYSLVIDVKPGTTVGVVCDIHQGMAESISVVDDGEKIPDPTQVAVQVATEFGQMVGASQEAFGKGLEASAKMMASSGGKATVQMGADAGRAAGNLFYPSATVIKAGDSVTWQFGEGAIEPHTVSMPPIYGKEVNPIPQEGKPPVLALGETLAPMTKTGSTVKTGDKFSSGLIVPVPGTTYSLTFADPGVYPYFCSIHPGMAGVVVVQPK